MRSRLWSLERSRSPFRFTKECEILIEAWIDFSSGKNMKLRIVLEPSDDGGYTVYVPSLPGCISEGDDVEDSLRNIQEAIELYLEPIEDEVFDRAGVLVRELVL